jgi:hypothetical protein
MRNAASHASTLQRHGDILALQQMQLGSIQHEISNGNARLYDQLDDLKNHRTAVNGRQVLQATQTDVTQSSNKCYISSKTRNSVRFRLPLMGWLAGRTWEIAVSQSQASWTFQINFINYRAPDSVAFRHVREGNIMAVDELIRAGQLSIWDVPIDEFSKGPSLLSVSVAPDILCVYVRLTWVQMAVKHRQLELCDYLLTRFEPLRNDDQLQEAALMLDLVPVKWRKRYTKQWFELFVGKFGMDVDVIDASSRLLQFFQDNFQELSEVILSHQSVDLTEWPLQARFKVAMRLENRTPLEFMRIVGLPVSNELAQLSDAQMGTALHWAAKEWHQYANFAPGPGTVQTSRHNDREAFVLALLEHKQLLHALDKYGKTPLTSLTCQVRWGYNREQDELWLPYDFSQGFVVPTEHWSMLLHRAGVPLPQYVARENVLLKTHVNKYDLHLMTKLGRAYVLSRFVLSKYKELQLEATALTTMNIWEFRPPPGLFLNPSHDESSKIFWPPNADDRGDRPFWQKTSSRDLRSSPFRLTTSHELHTDEFTVFRALFQRTHDDHSALALLAGRDRRRRAHEEREKSRHKRPRSSSMPPPLGVAHLHKKPAGFTLYRSRFRVSGEGNIVPRLHKCPFDSQWGFSAPNEHTSQSWRACMKGCQGRVDYWAMFERFLAQTAAQLEPMASEPEALGRIVIEID